MRHSSTIGPDGMTTDRGQSAIGGGGEQLVNFQCSFPHFFAACFMQLGRQFA